MRTHHPRRRSVVVLVAGLLLCGIPGSAAAAVPVAVDDPSVACGNAAFGGAFPIPEDFTGGSPGYETWFYLFGSCGPLANDLDVDGDPLTWAVVDEPANGEVLKIDETSFAYRPDADVSTIAGDQPGGTWYSDAFSYRAHDGTDESNVGTYRFWIAPVNDPPTFTAGPDITVAEASGPYSATWATAIAPGPANESGQSVTFDLDVDDGGVPGLFAVEPLISSDGTLAFTPGPDAGIATITVRAVDDGGLEDYGLPVGTMVAPDDTSDAVTFQILIEHAAQASDDEVTIEEDAGPWLIDVLANDDPGGPEPLSVTGVSSPSSGTAEVAPDGSAVLYTPDADAHGTDAFAYTTSGGPSATVTVTITPVNDAPIADDDHFIVEQGSGEVTLDVLDGDIDIDSAFGIVGKVKSRDATILVAADGQSLTFRPKPGRTSTSFTYEVADTEGLRDRAIVTVDIVSAVP